ncbi:hypothetical protein ACWER6_30425 [Streptomyces sp. NPDC004009]
MGPLGAGDASPLGRGLADPDGADVTPRSEPLPAVPAEGGAVSPVVPCHPPDEDDREAPEVGSGAGAEGRVAGPVPPVSGTDRPRSPTASLTVVPLPPLKLLPDTSSYVVMPAMVTAKTTAAATTGRRQVRVRARYTIPSPNPSGAGATSRRGRTGGFVSLSCSPVRRKKCWKSVPPQVATTLTTPAPRIVPYTPKYEASLAATTAARALPATWGTLRSIRLRLASGVSRIPGTYLPFTHSNDLVDRLHEKGTHGRNH